MGTAEMGRSTQAFEEASANLAHYLLLQAGVNPGLPLGRKNAIIYFSSGSMRANLVRGSMTATWDAKDWFVLLRGKQYGPYTYAGLVRAAASGIVDPKAGVWCVGWDEWRIARDVPGLFEQEPEPSSGTPGRSGRGAAPYNGRSGRGRRHAPPASSWSHRRAA